MEREDCKCPELAATMTVGREHGQGDEISCSWAIREPGALYAPQIGHETWSNYDKKDATEDFVRYADNPSPYHPGLKQKAQEIRNHTEVDKWGSNYRILEEEFGEDKASLIWEQRYMVTTNDNKAHYRYYGRRHILYNDIYTIHMGAEQFASGQETKEKMDALEACLKAMLDRKEAARAAPGNYVVSGVVTDGFGNKIKHARVALILDGKETQSTTNEGGYYEFPYNGSVQKNVECELVVSLQYHKDNKTYFRIIHNGNSVWVSKKFRINRVEDLIQDLNMTDGLSKPTYDGQPNPAVIKNFGIMHAHMAEALEYYMDYYHANVDYKLPVDVWAFVKGMGTQYISDDSTIVIGFEDSLHTSPHRPMNREWHEFSHHVMYSMYGRWPAPKAGAQPAEINHDGFINPSTSDSFVEGFAEYGSLMIGDYYKYPGYGVYEPLGSFEVDYKTWHYRGQAEEMAVAGVLWDLYDERNDDSIDFTSDQIWDLLKTYNPDFTSFYNALVAKYPAYKNEIDDIFKAHGFWADKNAGNGIWDPPEPFREQHSNTRYDAGEYFVDYPPNWTFEQGEKTGPATNYQRTDRTSAVKLPGHYVKVSGNVPYYTVNVKFPKNPALDYAVRTENRGGLVYVQVPPAEYEAEITVKAGGVSTGKPLVFTSQQFNEKLDESISRGYFTEHDFQTSGSPPMQSLVPSASQAPQGQPHWGSRGTETKPGDYAYRPPEKQGSLKTGPGGQEGPLPTGLIAPQALMWTAGGIIAAVIAFVGFAVLAAAGFVLLLAVVVYLLLRRRRKRGGKPA